MTGGSTGGAILFAAIPVTAMLVIEVVLPHWKNRRRDATSRQDEANQARRDVAFTGEDVDATARRIESDQTRRDVASTKRWRQNGHYYQVLHQTAHAGNLASMDKLGEFALVRKDFVEAFYWKLMVELHHGRPSGLPARGVCRAWQAAGCPEAKTDEGGPFKENQAKLSMAVLDLWSGRHVQTPTETIRQMMEEGDEDALLYAGQFGIGGSES